jgi:threonine/homoserine/homoserine lactone efflux protein
VLGIHDFGVFVASGVVLNITPGPDTFYILGRGIAQGRAAGIASVLGISTGALIHTLAAGLGLSALLAASASAFLVLKLAGAGYLVYLGARMLVGKISAAPIPANFADADFSSVYRQGLLTNLLNPKVALFFLAFMPQFIAADSPRKGLAFVALGLCFVSTGTLWCLGLAWFASAIGSRLRRNAALATVVNRAAGALFVGLGVRLVSGR